MNKISNAQVAALTKTAAETVRALSENNQRLAAENGDLKEKVAHFEMKSRAEDLARVMESKGIDPDIPFHQKVAGIMERNLDVVEEALNFSSPQVKLASLVGDDADIDGLPGDVAASRFYEALLDGE